MKEEVVPMHAMHPEAWLRLVEIEREQWQREFSAAPRGRVRAALRWLYEQAYWGTEGVRRPAARVECCPL